MAIKGQVKTQSHYEKEEKFIKLLKESISHGEITPEQLADALKLISFSHDAAAAKAKEWASDQAGYDNPAVMKKRLKDLASLEKYFVKRNFGKKLYEEMDKNKELKLIFS